MIQDLGYLSFYYGWVSYLFSMVFSLCIQTVCFLAVEVGSHAHSFRPPGSLSASRDSQLLLKSFQFKVLSGDTCC